MKTLRLIALILCCPLFEHAVWAGLPSGRVVGWGSNISGEATGAPSPQGYSTGVVAVAGQVLSNVVAVSAGVGHSLALRANGTVCGWGANFFGEAIGVKTDYPYRTSGPVSISGQVVTNIADISAGCGFSLAVKTDGTVLAWGRGAEKERSHVMVPLGLSNVISVAAGCNYSMALRKDGTVVGWGVRKVPAGLSNIVAIAAGSEYQAASLALRKDGVVFEWRPGVDYENGHAATSNAVAVAAGSGHCLALRRDGTVFGWWGNGRGEATGTPTTAGSYTSSGLVMIGGRVLSNVVAIAAGNGFSLALKNDGTVVAWGRMNNGLSPAAVPRGLRGVLAIAAGDNFCLAITTDNDAAP